MLQPVTLLWNMCSVLECLFLFWSVWFRPLPIYPIVFWHPTASWRKTQHTASMEASKQTGSEIAHCTQSKKPLHPSNKLYDQRHNKTQINKLINLQCNLATLRDHRVWGGVGRRNNCLQYFEFRLQYPFQLLAVLKSHKNGIPSQTILILYKTHKYLKFMSWLGQNLINMISCLVWMHKIRG